MKLPHALDVKVNEGTLYNHFTIYPDHQIAYEIMERQALLVCIADATLEDLQQDEEYGHVMRLLIRTRAHAFEILPVPDDRNGRYLAYKIIIKPTSISDRAKKSLIISFPILFLFHFYLQFKFFYNTSPNFRKRLGRSISNIFISRF